MAEGAFRLTFHPITEGDLDTPETRASMQVLATATSADNTTLRSLEQANALANTKSWALAAIQPAEQTHAGTDWTQLEILSQATHPSPAKDSPVGLDPVDAAKHNARIDAFKATVNIFDADEVVHYMVKRYYSDPATRLNHPDIPLYSYRMPDL